MYVLATHKLCESYWPTFMNGEFIVSRKRVLHQPLSLWKYIGELLQAPLGHFIHSEGTTPERPKVYDSTLSDVRALPPLRGCAALLTHPPSHIRFTTAYIWAHDGAAVEPVVSLS